MATPKAQEAYEEMFATLGGQPCRALLAQHWARLVEMVQNAETLKTFCDDPEITGDEFRVVPQQITGEGVGIVEAMRGTLTHHYTCDENGICTSANLIVGTTNNNAPIQMVTKKVAQALIKPGQGARPGHPQHGRDGVPRLRPMLQLRHPQPAGPDAAAGQGIQAGAARVGTQPQLLDAGLAAEATSDARSVPSRPEAMKTLLLGMGNPILCDDAVGLRLTAESGPRSAACSDLVTSRIARSADSTCWTWSPASTG